MVSFNAIDRLYLISSTLSIIASILMFTKHILIVSYGAKELVIDLTIILMFILSIITLNMNTLELKFCKVNTAYWRTNMLSYCNILVWGYVCIIHRFLRVNPIIANSTIYPLVFNSIGIISFIISLLTIIVICLFPIPTHRQTTGLYQHIGTKSFNIPVDEEHPLYDTFHPSSCRDHDQCLIPIQVWFPIKQPYGREKYHNNSNSTGIQSKLPLILKYCMLWTSGCGPEEEEELLLLANQLCTNNGVSPNWIFHHLLLSVTNSEYQFNYNNIELNSKTKAKAKLPVAIYSHGLHGWRQCHASQCEDLASHGYIVFSIDHSPCSTMARPAHALHYSQGFDYRVPASIDNALSAEGKQFYVDGVNRRVSDMTILLDYLSMGMEETRSVGTDTGSNTGTDTGTGAGEKNHDILLQDIVDMDNIHVWGHSYGGVSAACLAYRDTRVQSVVALDGWFFPIPNDMVEYQELFGNSADTDNDTETGTPNTRNTRNMSKNNAKNNAKNTKNMNNKAKTINKRPNTPNPDHKPHILMLSSHEWDISRVRLPEKDLLLTRNFDNLGLNLVLKGSSHQNLCDLCYLASNTVMKFIPNSVGSGIDSNVAIELTSFICLGYFNMISAQNEQKIRDSIDIDIDTGSELVVNEYVGSYSTYVNTVSNTVSNTIPVTVPIPSPILHTILSELMYYCQHTYRYDTHYLYEIFKHAHEHIDDIHNVFVDDSKSNNGGKTNGAGDTNSSNSNSKPDSNNNGSNGSGDIVDYDDDAKAQANAQAEIEAHATIKQIEYLLLFFAIIFISYLIHVYFIVIAKKKELSEL